MHYLCLIFAIFLHYISVIFALFLLTFCIFDTFCYLLDITFLVILFFDIHFITLTDFEALQCLAVTLRLAETPGSGEMTRNR